MKKYAFLLCLILLYAGFAKAQWSLTGNTGTNPTTNFLGTKDNHPLRFRTNNTWAGELNPATGNIFLGLRTGIGNTTAFSNVGIGTDALRINTIRSNLVAIGDSALFNNVNGTLNTAIGSKALYNNNNGIYNTALGYQALYVNTVGNFNTASGVYALKTNSGGSNNTASGVFALTLNTSGNNNTATGYLAMYVNSSGTANNAYGIGALYGNQTGNNNVAIGNFALQGSTYSSYNVGIGDNTLSQTTGSQYNTVVGFGSATQYDLGYNNTILGANCDAAFTGCYNDISIGQGVTCTDNSQARIGNSATWSIGGYAGWSTFSDGRYKKDIQENIKGLDFIMKLRPVTYHLNVSALSKQLKENHGVEWNSQMKKAMAEKEKILLAGFVAQEVEQAARETGFEFSGIDKPRTDSGLYALRYAEFVVPLVKAMQEQQQIINDLQKKVKTLQERADTTILLRETFSAGKISAYPDPVSNQITVSINTQTAGNGTLQIFDSSGKLVKQMNIAVQQGSNAINLSLPGLAAGYYTLKMDWGNTMHRQISFVKTN